AGPPAGPRLGAPGGPGGGARPEDRRSLRGSACAHHSADTRGRRQQRRDGAGRPNASAAGAGARARPLGAVVLPAIDGAPPAVEAIGGPGAAEAAVPSGVASGSGTAAPTAGRDTGVSAAPSSDACSCSRSPDMGRP